MSKGVYRTAMGQLIDMDKLRLMNERQPAVGNMSVNARGDDINPDGSIAKSRNQKMREHYTEPVVKYNPNKRPKAPAPKVENEVKEDVVIEEENILTNTELPKTTKSIQNQQTRKEK